MALHGTAGYCTKAQYEADWHCNAMHGQKPLPTNPLNDTAMPSARRTDRVIKTLAPTDRGALGLARQYGGALVCVRHRTDPDSRLRHTTVELLVDSTPIQRRQSALVQVRTETHERDLHALIRAAGGHWDGKACVWHLPKQVVRILKLHDRIVQFLPEDGGQM